MFRDLKEYQEIAKIYAEKVSKPAEAKSDELVENQENRRKLTQQRTKQNQGRVEKQFELLKNILKPKPRNLKDGQTSVRQSGVNDPRRKKIETNKEPEYKPEPELKVKPTYQSNRDKMIQSRSKNRLKSREEVGLGKNVKLSDNDKKDTSKVKGEKVKVTPFKDTSMGKNTDSAIKQQVDKYVEKRKVPINKDLTIDKAAGGTGMSNIPSKEGSAVIDGKKLNPDFGKKVEIKKEPEISKFTKQGKPRTKAQMMAAKRIAAGKTISDVKAENEASMRAKAAERNQKFQAAKKSGNLAQFRKDNPKMSGADRAKAMARARLAKKAAMEEYTPYDIVLEYLLSSEQVATIEEANYVMTEMDAETIQGIVEMQGQINRADIIGGTPAAKNAVAGKGKYTPGKGVTKDFKLDPSFKLPKV